MQHAHLTYFARRDINLIRTSTYNRSTYDSCIVAPTEVGDKLKKVILCTAEDSGWLGEGTKQRFKCAMLPNLTFFARCDINLIHLIKFSYTAGSSHPEVAHVEERDTVQC